MAAPEGNEYYLLRSKHGRDKEYNSDKLLETANEYFNWCLENPLLEHKTYHSQGVITNASEKKMRAFSLQGLCNFLEVSKQTFLNYEKDKDFFDVTTRIRGIIENQQFEGAASGFLNPNIIARKLGLIDKSEVKIDTPMTSEERAKRIQELQNKIIENN